MKHFKKLFLVLSLTLCMLNSLSVSSLSAIKNDSIPILRTDKPLDADIA